MPNIFPWSGYAPKHGYSGKCRYPLSTESVLLKSHYPFLQRKRPLPAARENICLIRHPIDVLYSFYLYRQNGGVKELNFSDFLRLQVIKWKEFYAYWKEQENVLMIRYEDLYDDPVFWLEKIVQVLGYDVEKEDILRAVSMFPPKGGLVKSREYYQLEDLDFMKNELEELLLTYEYDL